MQNLFSLRIRNFPLSAKALTFGYCLALGLAYIYAMGNIAMVVGLTPEKIAIHYYGSATASYEEKKSGSEEVLNLDLVAKDAPIQRPSFKQIVAEGHFHLFGMTSFFFGLTLLGLFTSVPEKWKIAMVSVPFFSVILDNLSFLATRFMGPNFAYFTALSGGLMGLKFYSPVDCHCQRTFNERNKRQMKIIFFALSFYAVNALSETLVEMKDFLKVQLAGSPSMSKETFKLDGEVAKELKNIASLASNDSFTFYYGKTKEGKMEKVCTVVPQQGKEGPMTVGVCFDPAGVIKKVVILSFVEDHGQKVKEEGFLKQFLGKNMASHFAVGDDIDGISGATYSSKAVSEAVRKSAFAFKKFVKKK